jgi:hypothetical protein
LAACFIFQRSAHTTHGGVYFAFAFNAQGCAIATFADDAGVPPVSSSRSENGRTQIQPDDD